MISKRVVSGRWMLELFLLPWSEYCFGHENLTYVMEGNYVLMLSKMIQNQPECLWPTFYYDIKEGGEPWIQGKTIFTILSLQ